MASPSAKLSVIDALQAFSIMALCCVVGFGPNVFVDQKFEDGGLLVPSGEVVELDQLVKTKTRVDGRHRELGGVDRTFFQRREDFTARQQRRGHAQLLHHFAAQTEESASSDRSDRLES